MGHIRNVGRLIAVGARVMRLVVVGCFRSRANTTNRFVISKWHRNIHNDWMMATNDGNDAIFSAIFLPPALALYM